jgi:hypothetical protein
MNIKSATISTLVTVAALVIGVFLGAYAFRGVSPIGVLGAASDCYNGYTCFTYVNALNDLKTDGTFSAAGDATFSGGTLTVATSNTATSTVILGCVQSYATSTLTPWKWLTVASSTQIAPGYNGYVLAQYGTCPNL